MNSADVYVGNFIVYNALIQQVYFDGFQEKLYYIIKKFYGHFMSEKKNKIIIGIYVFHNTYYLDYCRLFGKSDCVNNAQWRRIRINFSECSKFKGKLISSVL